MTEQEHTYLMLNYGDVVNQFERIMRIPLNNYNQMFTQSCRHKDMVYQVAEIKVQCEFENMRELRVTFLGFGARGQRVTVIDHFNLEQFRHLLSDTFITNYCENYAQDIASILERKMQI